MVAVAEVLVVMVLKVLIKMELLLVMMVLKI